MKLWDYINCGLLYKYHWRHAYWKRLLLSLQWVCTNSGLCEIFGKNDDALLEYEVLDNNVCSYEID